MGVYVSGHPMLDYEEALKAISWDSSMFEAGEDEDGGEAQSAVQDGDQGTLAGIVSSVTVKNTKSGDVMAFVNLEDLRGSVELVVFPRVYRQYRSLLEEADVVLTAQGRVSAREGENAKLIVTSFTKLQKDQKVTPTRLFVRIPKGTSEFQREAMQGALATYPGRSEVYLLDEETGKKYRLRSCSVQICGELLADLNRVLEADCVQTA